MKKSVLVISSNLRIGGNSDTLCDQLAAEPWNKHQVSCTAGLCLF